MSHGEPAVLEQFPDDLRELKNAQHVGDRSPVFSDGFCDLLLCQPKLM